MPRPVNARRGDAPTLGVVLTGGIGVLVALAFVGAVVFGRNTAVGPGERIAVVRSGAPAGFTVLVGRCEDERVTSVSVGVVDGPTLWRIESRKGVIDRSFPVGEEPPPFGAATVTAFDSVPAGVRLVALVGIGRTGDAEEFDPEHLESADAPEAPCGGSDLGAVPVMFILGAAGVVVAYGAMVRRYLAR
jgi:hypothetical protein